MSEPAISEPVIIDASALTDLVGLLRADGYTVIGPTVRNGAIALEELTEAAALPFGWGVDT
jgi:sulfhydrogenase subunit beta (sulfur reductase)